MRFSVHSALILMLAGSLPWSYLSAQKGGGGGGSKGAGTAAPAMNPSALPNYDPKSTEGWFDPYPETRPDTPDRRLKNEQPSCFEWPMSPVVSGVVNVTRLVVPVGAREGFSQACAAVLRKDVSEAERELNRAIKSAPKFAPAWVLLGQIQKDGKKLEQAQQSCTEAHNADTSYLPAYLCLADLAARQNSWTRTVEWTNRALALHPVRAPGAYYLNALASFYLGQSLLAEKSARRALEDERREQKPSMRWLLAKIYEARGDRVAEADQLREYLRLAPRAPDAPLARKILQEIEREGNTPASSNAKPGPD